MRVRCYEDYPDGVYFLEIKNKKVNVVRKYRAPVHDKDWNLMLEFIGDKPIIDSNNSKSSNKDLFLRLFHSYNASPKVLTQYVRKAYVSNVDNYGRVTFDKDLRYRPAEGYDINPDTSRTVPYDNETVFEPECNVILEHKCYTTRVPLWMIDLIHYFNLRRISFSKYVTSVSQILSLFQREPLHMISNSYTGTIN